MSSDKARAKKLFRYRSKAKVVSPDNEVEYYLSGERKADRYIYHEGIQGVMVYPYVRRKGVGIDEIYDCTDDKLRFVSKEDAERFCKYIGKELINETYKP